MSIGKKVSEERTVASFSLQLYSVKCLSQLRRNSSCVLRSCTSPPTEACRERRRESRYILLRPPAGAPIHTHSHTSLLIPSSCSADVKTTYLRFCLWFLKQNARRWNGGGAETRDKWLFILLWEAFTPQNKCFPARHQRCGNELEANSETVNHPRKWYLYNFHTHAQKRQTSSNLHLHWS